jgi:tRNA-specific 2-thiouridylase
MPGPILLRDGRQIGEHSGLPNFTIGQRKGINLSWPEALYVLATDSRRNALIVGPASELGRDSLIAHRVNWINGMIPAGPFRAEVKIRYKARPVAAMVTPLPDNRMQVQFDSPVRDITPGQGAICYDGDVCLGGGLIEKAAEAMPA